MKLLLTFTLIFNLQFINAALIPAPKHVLHPIGSTSGANLQDNFKILVWNLHKGETTGFENDFKKLTLNKDLILAQEFFLNGPMENLFLTLNNFEFMTATSFLIGQDRIRTGVTTGSFSPTKSTNYLRTINLEPITATPKMALITQYWFSHENEYLTVVNLHGINFVSNKVFQIELDRLFNSLNKAEITNHPLIIGGDFNTWTAEKIDYLNLFRVNLGLLEAQFSPDHRLQFNQFPLDHVLYSKHLKLISGMADNTYQGSDHIPLELEFQLLHR